MMWPDLIFPPINLWIMPKMTSPCKNECLYDKLYGFCVSCGRTTQEITNWTRFSDTMRSTINEKAKNRLDLIKRDK